MGCCRISQQRGGVQLGHRGLRMLSRGPWLDQDLSKKAGGEETFLGGVLGVLQESKSPCFVGYRWLAMVSSASSETRTCEFSG